MAAMRPTSFRTSASRQPRCREFPQPSLSLRWHPATPEKLTLKASALILIGCGRPAIFNDRAIIPALEQAGVRPEHSWDYSIAGCEELAVGGKVFGVCRTGTVNQAQCVLDALREPADIRRLARRIPA